MGQKDVGPLSECILDYLRDLPSPIIPACIYPQLQTALTLQQQALDQAAGRAKHAFFCQASLYSKAWLMGH